HYVVGVPLLVIVLYVTMNWMMTPQIALPPLAKITGSVTLDGKPLPNVMVYLSPVDPNGKSTSGKPLKLRDAMGVTDEDGFYRAFYIGTTEGVPLGKVRPWLRAINTADERKIPGQYQSPG